MLILERDVEAFMAGNYGVVKQQPDTSTRTALPDL